jgi:hypothetical protein
VRSAQVGCRGKPCPGQAGAGSLKFILRFGRGRPDTASRVGP